MSKGSPRPVIFQESPLPPAGSAAFQRRPPVSREASGAHAPRLPLQLQGGGVGLRQVLLQLQPQVVDANAGDLRHVAVRRLSRARRGGAVQHEAHHDDSEGQDVEPGELGGEQEGAVVSGKRRPAAALGQPRDPVTFVSGSCLRRR